MVASPSTPPDFTRLAAPLLFGPLFNWTLYGALCIQIYVYSYNFPNDKLSIKVLAYFLFVLETVQTALTGADLYFWFVAGFGDVERLKDTHFAPIDIPIMTAVTSFFVQGYFCYRIWMLNKRLLWFCWVIAICTVTQSTGAIWGAVTSLTGNKFEVSKAPLYLWSTMSATADIMIAVAMTLLLRRAHGKFSNFVLIRVVRLTIETNALTASVAVASLVLYAAFPNQAYYAFTLDFIGKLYSNTFLVSLNNRIYLRDRLSSESHDGAGPTVSDRVRIEVVTLTRLSGAELRSSSDTSQPLGLDKGHGNGLGPDIPATA
ncbi:hypothetical protein EDB85DRAFT_2238114 [Lactarius pseudohatsudake]|nr:hypothetical protein EDB85DRAFT_2238114 [Lactarius pseudohatsudake]